MILGLYLLASDWSLCQKLCPTSVKWTSLFPRSVLVQLQEFQYYINHRQKFLFFRSHITSRWLTTHWCSLSDQTCQNLGLGYTDMPLWCERNYPLQICSYKAFYLSLSFEVRMMVNIKTNVFQEQVSISWRNLLPPSSRLSIPQTDIAGCSKTLVLIYRIIWCNISDHYNLKLWNVYGNACIKTDEIFIRINEIFHYGNMPSYTTHLVKRFLAKEQMSVLNYSLYSSDFLPYGFFMFLKLNNFLKMLSFWTRWHNTQSNVISTWKVFAK
jgi:hypothetical protein